jgi:2-dehydro-3-deoxyphosphogluconate aldolase / (4S)-4-hydroxy-2-oxoglutarate aldolase
MVSKHSLSRAEVTDRIMNARLIVILRGFSCSEAVQAGTALTEGGARVLELSLVDSGAVEAIAELRRDLPADQYLVGAGTVLTERQAQEAADAGADFLFSPGLDQAVLQIARDRDLLAIPGVLTPTEITAALRLQLTLMKLFPAEPLGPGYIRQLRGPFPLIQLIPTGGVSSANASDYLAAGAVGVGAGTSIANPAWARESDYHRFAQAAADLLQTLVR